MSKWVHCSVSKVLLRPPLVPASLSPISIASPPGSPPPPLPPPPTKAYEDLYLDFHRRPSSGGIRLYCPRCAQWLPASAYREAEFQGQGRSFRGDLYTKCCTECYEDQTRKSPTGLIYKMWVEKSSLRASPGLATVLMPGFFSSIRYGDSIQPIIFYSTSCPPFTPAPTPTWTPRTFTWAPPIRPPPPA